MTDKEFQKLCSTTEIGEPISVRLGDEQASGKFCGCSEDGLMIEVKGQVSIWPADLVEYRKSEYTGPSYA